jgi:hypothetical protein
MFKIISGSMTGNRRARRLAKADRGRPARPWVEALESRVMLTATAPFGLAAFTQLGGTQLGGAPTLIAGPGGLGAQPIMDLDHNGVGDMIVQFNNTTPQSAATKSTVAAVLVNPDGTARTYTIAEFNFPILSPVILDQTLVADLNHDGQPDVVVLSNDGLASNPHRKIDVYLGEPDGTFTHPSDPAVTIDLGASAAAPTMALFDMNGDGNNDIFLHGGFKMTVIRGNGDGTFLAPVLTTIPGIVRVSNLSFQDDLSGDGIPDLVISGTNGQINPDFTLAQAMKVFKGQTTGDYNLTPTFTDATDSLTFLSLNQLSTDNMPDIVAYSDEDTLNFNGPATVFVFRNNGSGGFTKTFTSSLLAGGFLSQLDSVNTLVPLATPDLNNDGAPDMLLYEGSENVFTSSLTIHVLKNTGNGGFTDVQELVVPNFDDTSTVTVADIDNDTFPDLFVSGQGEIFFNNATAAATFVAAPVTPAHVVVGPDYPRVADFTGDGKMDVVFSGAAPGVPDGGSIEILVNTTGRAFSEVVHSEVTSVNLSFHDATGIPNDPLLDFTGDGNPDMISYDVLGASGFAILSSDANGILTLPLPVTTGDGEGFAPITGDFNHDGKPDLAFFNDVSAIKGVFILINGQASPTDTAGTDSDHARDLGTLTGPLALTEFVDATASNDDRDNHDFYKFTLTDAATVRFTAAAEFGKVDLILNNDQGFPIVQVDFTPTAVATETLDPGTYFINVEHNSGPNLPYRLDIAFPSAGPAVGVLDGFTQLTSGQAAALDFGDVFRTTTDTTQNFTVRNDGRTTLNLGAMTLPAGFAIVGNSLPASINAGQSATVTVKMLTDTVGDFSGNISIPSDDPAGPFLIPVSGSVEELLTPPVLTPLMVVTQAAGVISSGQPFPVSLGFVQQHGTPLQLTFNVANTGTAPLTLGALNLPAGFSLVEGLSTSIAPGGNDDFTIKLTSTATVGDPSGNITFTNNSGGASNTFSLPIIAHVTGIPVLPPDLTGSIGDVVVAGQSVTTGIQAVPGDVVTVKLHVVNSGAGDLAAQSIGVALSASADQTLDGSDFALATVSVKLPALAAGGHADVSFTVKLPGDISAGDDFLLAKLDSANTVAESNEVNNTAVADHVLPVVLAAGQVGTRKNVKLTFLDDAGNLVTIAVAKGTAQVTAVDPVTGALDLDVAAGSAVTLTAKPPTGAGGAVGHIKLRNITIGSAPAGAPAFGAAAAVAPPLTTFTAKNATITGVFDAPDGLKTLTLEAADGATINIGPSASLTNSIAITIGRVTNTSIHSLMNISKLTAINWLDSDATADTISAPVLTALKITGDKKSVTAGDFQAGLDIGGAAGVKLALGTVAIAGALGSGDAQDPAVWSVTGAAGSVSAGATGGWSLTGATALATLKLGRVASATLAGSADLGAITATEWLAGSISAASVKSIKTTGDTKNAVAGTFSAAVTLTGSADPKVKQTLGAATIAGEVRDCDWQIAGVVGALTAARLIDSSIRVGVDPAAAGLPDSADDFLAADALASIKSLTLKGLKGSVASDFVNSIVAARTIGAATLGRIATQNGGVAFGLAAQTLGPVTSIDPSGKKLKLLPPLTDGDFILRVI